ncbi:hypothetical protein PC118_g1534 [Phytophthora cactorum]|uniref:Uncharacterized protein n=1 Tax=Phytophthora cactorum TaxID=29920 RepID=A0A8T1GX37_9STRA|nr:hypothetical protein PC113_g2181 [Phytophthora cactorum]KAG2997978.1 hypothetical protein PC118_g1534 [Phytophthora cactorum]KAG3040068.1 hypothetical protein PC119_g1657 [Phytophthora cactorum]
MMQTYLLSFVITGNSNTMWPDDKLYWPQYNEYKVGTEIVFDDTFTVADDDLANSKSLFWNKELCVPPLATWLTRSNPNKRFV